MIGSRYLDVLRLLGGAMALGAVASFLPGPSVLAQTAPAHSEPVPAASAQFSAPGLPVSPDSREAGAARCPDCRGGEAGGPASSNTIITTPENKTIVPRTLMREQSDFRLIEALRNVHGITRR